MYSKRSYTCIEIDLCHFFISPIRFAFAFFSLGQGVILSLGVMTFPIYIKSLYHWNESTVICGMVCVFRKKLVDSDVYYVRIC